MEEEIEHKVGRNPQEDFHAGPPEPKSKPEKEVPQNKHEYHKCYIRMFIYSNGTDRTFHSVCHGHNVSDWTEDFAKSLLKRPGVTLLEVQDGVHYIKKDNGNNIS